MPQDRTGQDRTGQEKEIPPLFPHINGAKHAKRRKPTTFITENFRGDIGCIALAGELKSTLRPNSAVSLITTSPSERPAPIGKPLSEHGLAKLRSFAQSVQSDNLLDDQALETLLVQHFGRG